MAEWSHLPPMAGVPCDEQALFVKVSGPHIGRTLDRTGREPPLAERLPRHRRRRPGTGVESAGPSDEGRRGYPQRLDPNATLARSPLLWNLRTRSIGTCAARSRRAPCRMCRPVTHRPGESGGPSGCAAPSRIGQAGARGRGAIRPRACRRRSNDVAWHGWRTGRRDAGLSVGRWRGSACRAPSCRPAADRSRMRDAEEPSCQSSSIDRFDSKHPGSAAPRLSTRAVP